jgi:hypothetical protein
LLAASGAGSHRKDSWFGRTAPRQPAAIRPLSDADLDSAAPASLYEDAPITCQFMLEDPAVRHSYHHLALIRAALKKEEIGAARP